MLILSAEINTAFLLRFQITDERFSKEFLKAPYDDI
jgi:hypothetical protein